MLILALDLGTSSTRAALFDSAARRLDGTTVQQTYPLHTTDDGGAEIEPADLLNAVSLCIAGALDARRKNPALKNQPIIGIGVSCFWHSLIGCDADGRPLTRVITWADSRCRGDAADLRAKFPEKKTHALTGCMTRASFWPAKLVWLRRTQPRLFAKVKRWMSPAEWLQLHLAGDANCAIGMATGTGLFNPAKLRWEPALLERCHVSPEQLLPLSDAPTPVAGGEFPELAGVPWFPGIGDGAASNLGSGATRPGLAAINVGTSAALRVMRSGGKVSAPLGLFCYRVDAARHLVGGAVSNAGNLRAWCLRELRLPDDATIERELAARPGPSSLVVLPFWTAERAPTWDESATGQIHGITQHTTALDLLQAITEASYQRIARIAELVFATEPQPPRIIVSGGIQRSPQAIQRLADVLGQPIFPNDEMEASIRGGAIFALEKLGQKIPTPQLGKPIRPRPKPAAAYATQREQQRTLENR